MSETTPGQGSAGIPQEAGVDAFGPQGHYGQPDEYGVYEGYIEGEEPYAAQGAPSANQEDSGVPEAEILDEDEPINNGESFHEGPSLSDIDETLKEGFRATVGATVLNAAATHIGFDKLNQTTEDNAANARRQTQDEFGKLGGRVDALGNKIDDVAGKLDAEAAAGTTRHTESQDKLDRIAKAQEDATQAIKDIEAARVQKEADDRAEALRQAAAQRAAYNAPSTAANPMNAMDGEYGTMADVTKHLATHIQHANIYRPPKADPEQVTGKAFVHRLPMVPLRRDVSSGEPQLKSRWIGFRETLMTPFRAQQWERDADGNRILRKTVDKDGNKLPRTEQGEITTDKKEGRYTKLPSAHDAYNDEVLRQRRLR